MPTNLLILPLLGGFLFLHLCHRFRFRAQRSDGYRLLLESSLAAVILLAAGRLSIVLLRSTPWGAELKRGWSQFAPIEYLGTGLAALVLGVGLALLDNWFHAPRTRSRWDGVPRWLRSQIDEVKDRGERNSDRARSLEIANHGNALARLFHEAETTSTLLSITLSNRKWYLGYIAEGRNLDPQDPYFRLLPILSGYRDTATLATARLTYYKPVYDLPQVDASRFVIVLALKDVLMASLFDETIYEEHFAKVDRTRPPAVELAAG